MLVHFGSQVAGQQAAADIKGDPTGICNSLSEYLALVATAELFPHTDKSGTGDWVTTEI